MMFRWLLIGAGLVSFLGCNGAGGVQVVPVSGKVTLNGKPLANAMVTFSPVAKPGEVNAGDGSTGKTNDQGEYTLKTTRGAPGAQVGKHKVAISLTARQVGTGDERPPRGGWPMKDKVPARYGGDGQLTFEVTAAGPNKADFEMTSP